MASDQPSQFFKGLRFFFLARMPLRGEWISKCKEHGGEVVKLEQQADIIIGDHAKMKNNPPNSVTWLYIDECVKQGRRLRPEAYPASQTLTGITSSPRHVGGSAPLKRSRATFTPQEDQALIEFVLQQPPEVWRGMKIYKEFAAKYPSAHTYQSWQDRFRKKLETTLTKEDIYRATKKRRDAQLGPSVPSPTPPIPPAQKIPVEEPRAPMGSSESKIALWLAQEPNANEVFTEEEVNTLRGYWQAIRDTDENKVADSWEAFAGEYTNHTAASWYRFWKECVEPMGPIKESSIESSEERAASLRPQSAVSAGGSQEEVELAPRSRPSTTPPKKDPQEPAPSASASMTVATEKTSQKEKTQVAVPTVVTETRVVEEVAETADDTGHEVASENQIVGPSDFDSEYFEMVEDFVARAIEWCEGDEERPLARIMTIKGHDVDMAVVWALINTSLYEDFSHVTETRSWFEVAAHVGLPTEDDVVLELYRCCQILDDYIAYCAEQSEGEVTREQDGQPEEEALPAEHLNEILESSPTKRKSVPFMASTPSRRPEYGSKGKEREAVVPETPEQLQKSPKAGIRSLPAKTSQSTQYSQTPRQLVSSPAKKNVTHLPVTEPETQDFHFSQPLPIDEQDDEDDDTDTFPNLKARSKAVDKGPRVVVDDESTQSQTESQNEKQLLEFIEGWISLGYSEQVVRQALQATTMTTANVGEVAESLAKGNGIPKDMPGVWTAEEDELVLNALRGKPSNSFFWLFDKHGERGVALRQKFLQDIGMADP